MMNKNIPFSGFFYSLTFLLFLSNQFWFLLWLIMEMNTLSFLCFLFSKKNNNESVLLYFLIQSFSSLLMILSILMNELFLTTMFMNHVLLLVAVMFKMGAYPLHNWVPAVTQQNKLSVLFLLLVMQKIIPLIWLLNMNSSFISIILLFSLLNIFWISPQNLNQQMFKNIIVFSSMAHTGWLMMTTSSHYLWQFYFIIYLVIMIFIVNLPNENMKLMNSKNNGVSLLLIFFSLAGLPPLMSFFPKFMLISYYFKIKMMMLMSLLLLISLMDFFIYSQISLKNSLKTKSSMKWQKQSSEKMMFVMLNILILMTLII